METLDAYISRTNGLPDDAYQTRDPSKLPKNLQVLLTALEFEGPLYGGSCRRTADEGSES